MHAWRASKACTVGRAEAESRDDVKAESCELAAAMRPSGCMDSDGVRCNGACGSTSSASGSAGAICFSSSAHAFWPVSAKGYTAADKITTSRDFLASRNLLPRLRLEAVLE